MLLAIILLEMEVSTGTDQCLRGSDLSLIADG